MMPARVWPRGCVNNSRSCRQGNDANDQREGQVQMRLFKYVAHIAGGGVLAATMLTAAMPAVAQDASPAAGGNGAACTGEPRDIDELVDLYFGSVGTPLATPANASVNSEAELPQGEPVDPAVEEAVNA